MAHLALQALGEVPARVVQLVPDVALHHALRDTQQISDGPGALELLDQATPGQNEAPTDAASEAGTEQAAELRAELDRLRDQRQLELAEERAARAVAETEARHLPERLARRAEHIADLQKALVALIPRKGAGGTPPLMVQAHELVSRVSQDLDLATDSFAGMDEIVHALLTGLEDKRWGINVVEVAPRMARLIAMDPVTGDQCELDVLKEIFPKPPAETDAGRVLSRDDAVGLKVRALHDRGSPGT